MAFVQGMIIILTTKMAAAWQFTLADSLISKLIYHSTSSELHIQTISYQTFVLNMGFCMIDDNHDADQMTATSRFALII